MEINLFSKCIKDLIVENDRVDVPYLGTFLAEMMPASYSDRQTTIHPPYRKMSFHKGEVSLSEGRPLLDKVRKELGVSLDQAGVELGWCLSRLSSELEGSKICKLPGLGVMRANARNEFFFVPADDLDIWPDGIGFESISIKVSEKKEEIPDQVRNDEVEPEEKPEVKPEEKPEEKPKVEPEEKPEVKLEEKPEEKPEPQAVQNRPRRKLPGWAIVLIVLGVLLVLFVAASYLFTDFMSPVLDRLLYSKEELELLRGR